MFFYYKFEFKHVIRGRARALGGCANASGHEIERGQQHEQPKSSTSGVRGVVTVLHQSEGEGGGANGGSPK